MFISFEGCEGSGKSTQVDLLIDYLEKKSYSCVSTQEPGGTHLANKIRNIILSRNLSVENELFLLMYARKDHVLKVINPAIGKKNWVICDRFVDSTMCYQGILKSMNIRKIFDLHKRLIGNIFPQVTFLLDISTCLIKKRLKSRLKKNFYDQMKLKEHDIVKKGFLHISNIFKDRVKVINADRDKILIHKEILEYLEPYMN